MASVKQQLSSKVTDFLYDHRNITSRGKNIRTSYKNVEKTIQNLGKEKKKD